MKTYMLAIAGLALCGLAQAQEGSAEPDDGATGRQTAATPGRGELAAKPAPTTPRTECFTAQDCETAVRTEYMAYAQANNIKLTPPPGSEGAASAEAAAEPAAPAGDSFSTFIVFILIVLGTVAAAVFYALAQARKREAQLPAGARQQKLKAQAKKQKKGKLQD